MKWKRKDFLTLQELSVDELEEFIRYITQTKESPEQPLQGCSVGNLFLGSCFYTKLVMETAITQLGGKSLTIDHVNFPLRELLWEEWAIVDNHNKEHIKDFAHIISEYVDCLAVEHVPNSQNWRKDRQDSVIKNLARYSKRPVINLESMLFHPCQALTDLYTMKQKLNNLRGWKAALVWTYQRESKHLSVPHSFALASCKYGMDLTIAAPSGYELDPGVLKLAEKNAQAQGGSLEVSHDPKQAVRGASIVYAVNWRSIDNYPHNQVDPSLKDWQVTAEWMEKTDGGYLLHPAPWMRNSGVTSEVLDGNNSLAYQQAKNRLDVQKAILRSALNFAGKGV